MYQELLTKHRQQISDSEQQQESRVAETLCDHWKVKDQMLYFVSLHSYFCKCIVVFSSICFLQKLRTFWSKRLGEITKDVFCTSVLAQTNLSAEHCEELWLDLEQELAAQLQQAECTTKLQLEDMRAQLDKDGQVETI